MSGSPEGDANVACAFVRAGDELAAGHAVSDVFARLAASAPESVALVHVGVVLGGVDDAARADALARVVHRLDARDAELREARAMQSEARLSGWMLAVMPVCVVALALFLPRC